ATAASRVNIGPINQQSSRGAISRRIMFYAHAGMLWFEGPPRFPSYFSQTAADNNRADGRNLVSYPLDGCRSGRFFSTIRTSRGCDDLQPGTAFPLNVSSTLCEVLT